MKIANRPRDIASSEIQQQLFAVLIEDDTGCEGGRQPSTANETPAKASQPETVPDASRRVAPSPASTSVGSPALLAVVKAAAHATTASAALDGAIRAARCEGHSWRAIADSAGIPHQTLHRRERRDASRQERG